ncbi:uncharacterized protein LOC144885875 isoform X1 [Branchiostoma floridae x Branchiostoma japonicum]
MTRRFVLVIVLTLLTWGVHSESAILDNQKTNILPEDEGKPLSEIQEAKDLLRELEGTTLSDEVLQLLRLLDVPTAATHEGSGGEIEGTTGNGTGMFDDDNEGHEDPDGDIDGDIYGDTDLDAGGSSVDHDEVAGNTDGYNEGDIEAQANDGDNEDKEGVSEDSSGDIEDMNMENTVRGTGVHGATFQIRSQSNVSSTCEVPVDLFWLLDGSNSVGTANFEKVKQFVVDVVNSFDVSPTATRVGVVQYSNKNNLMFNLGDKADKPSTVSAINSIQYQGGGTYTGYALKYVRQKAAWRGGNVPKVAVVLTDGESYDSVSVAAQNLLSDGVEVFAVGVAGFKHVQLLAIANSNETNVIELNDFNDLTTKIGEIAKKVCSYASEGPRDHAFEVLRTANQKYQGVDFFVIEARLPADGLSGFESWCRDYQRLCEQYGLRPTGCGEKYTTWNSGGSRSTCPTEYNSDMYINNVLGCYPNDGVKEVANMAFSAGATATNSFGFSYCAKKYCQRKIDKCRYSLYENTVSSYPNGDRIVYTVCKGSADTDDCAANPCVNGDCVDGVNSYTCTCHSGYEGINCDKDINGCSPNPCHTEATCEDIPAPGTGAKCTCKPGFVGDGTSGGSGCKPKNIDHCAANPCVNGDCADGVNSYTCTCYPGYEGINCDKDINGCSPNPCHTEATCEDIPAPGTGAKCTCKPGFVGDGISGGSGCKTKDIDHCAANPCVKGDCVAGSNGYTCSCYLGYAGTNCHENIDDCAANPCVNGDCVDGVNSYTCTCHSGYEGTNCDKDINGCSSNPCHTEATCEDIPAPGTGAKCTCKPGFVGDGKSGGSGCKETELSASTTCTNEYMELSIPKDQLTNIDQGSLHWKPDQNCGATANSTHYIFRTDLYSCGTQATFGSTYVTFLNRINILGIHPNSGVITREDDIWITSKCKYERQEWVDSTFLPIPGGLNFTEEGFGQLEVRLSMFPTHQYQNPYRGSQYPIHLRMRQHIYMQLEVQGHGQKLSVLALNCKATMSPRPDDTPQYQLIKDGCASDSTLHYYNINDRSKERFGFEAFRFIKDLKTVYVHCEVMVCDGADSRSRCAQGCVKRGKRATGEKTDLKGRHMIYQGPIILDDDKEETLRLMSDQETASGRHSAPWAMLAAGGGLMALALVVMGAAIVLKRSRREEWAYQGLPNMAEDGE